MNAIAMEPTNSSSNDQAGDLTNSVISISISPADDHMPPLSSAQVIEITEIDRPAQTHTEATGGGSISISGDHANTCNKSQRISMLPDLYRAAQNGDLQFFSNIDLKFQHGSSPLQGVTIGDNTVLHITAASSGSHFKWQHPNGKHVEFAREVYKRNRSLLMARNKLMETALHCAVKAGNCTMVSLLISFAEYEHDQVEVGEETLLVATNMHGETALHEAVRAGRRDIVNKLILSEPRLAGIVDAEGVSPLYLAAMTNAFEIVRVFTREEPSSLVSCAGPRGQTALHAAVLEHRRITSELLDWDESLATKIDDSGSTPLHYAASAGHLNTVKLLLQRGTSAAHISDKNGLYPVHVAAKRGKTSVIEELIEQVPDSDELLDKDGRNFLHIAIVSGKSSVMFPICRNPTFLRMLNARDYKGNTPLHLACKNGAYNVVTFLIALNVVCSSVMNREGLTPVDLSIQKIDRGFKYTLNTPYNVLRCLLWTGALPSPRRVDQLDDDLNIAAEDRKEEVEKAKSATRSLGIISVLIATVTFAAIFTMPGGYIADDHVNHGTPILSRKYAFKAFVVADLVAFALSMLATAWLIYAGFSIVDLNLRFFCAVSSASLLKIAGKATVCAFALATYTVLSPVNLPLSILILVTPFVLIPFSNPSYWRFLVLASPIKNRLGWIALFKPYYLLPTRRRVTVRVGVNYSLIKMSMKIMENLLLYLFIFLLALI